MTEKPLNEKIKQIIISVCIMMLLTAVFVFYSYMFFTTRINHSPKPESPQQVEQELIEINKVE